MKCLDWTEVRHKCLEETTLEGKEIKNTIVITFSFQVVFTAFNALQNLHSSLHDEESLGLICLSIIYFTAVISSVFSPTIIGFLGAKTVLVAFFLAHSVYVLANFYPAFATMVPAAVALGAFNGPAWTSQALYISANAYSFSKSSSASPYTILSRFNGFFFAMFATTQIVGNLVTSTVIRDGVGNQSDETIIFKYCGINDCPDNENVTEIEDPEDWVIDITLGFFMACCLCGLLLVFFLLSPLPKSDWIERVSVKFTATSCFSVLLTTDMLLLVPFILFTSVEHAFLMASFTKAYVTCAIGIHMVGYVMAAYGATTPIFVFLFIRLARIAGRFLLLSISLMSHIVLLAFLYMWSPTADSEALIFVIPMFWGVAESILLAQANSLITMLYPSQKEPAFANFHAWRSLGYSITFLNATYLCVSTKLILCMLCAALGLVLYIFVELKTRMREKLVFEARGSVISVPPLEFTVREETDSNGASTKRTSVSSLMSVQERLSFDHIELHDVIKEAQNGWRRDESGLTLELSKVMSSTYLKESKATKLFHTCASWTELSDLSQNSAARPAVLPRSLSDGNTSGSVYRVHTGSNKLLRSAPTLNGKRRAVSEIIAPTFDVIKDVVYEEEESDDLVMGNEADDDVFDNHQAENSPRKGSSESKSRSFMRRLSQTLQTINVEGPRKGSDFEITIESPTTPSPTGKVNFAFESDEDDIDNTASITVEDEVRPNEVSVRYKPKSGQLERPVSLEAKTKKRRSGLDLVIRGNKSLTELSAPSTPNKHSADSDKKRSRSVASMNSEGKSKRPKLSLKKLSILKKPKTPESPPPPEVKANELKEEDNEQDSGADSDGFVPEEVLAHEAELAIYNEGVIDISRPKTSKRKHKIPVMESEDVNCIY
ncbi:Protein unc-93 A [Biomphalaria glabrata]|nr:protein unc-93-like protein A-like isoform X1 [Biomphalaria glabrata]